MHNSLRFLCWLTGILAVSAPVSVAQQPASPKTVQPAPQRLEVGKPIERELKGGEIHSYSVALTKGQILRATADQRKISLLVRVSGPDGTTITTIDLPDKDLPITVDANTTGNYRFEVFSYDKDVKPGRYEIKLNEVLSAEANAARIAEALRQQQAMIGWLKTNAVPLRTVEAGNGFADLQPLKNVLKDVRFVSLGEATHGTREFFQAKHRLLEFLVREMGFRVFAMEASYAALQTVNDYVMGRMNDGSKALEDQGYWNWNTEEVLAMMDWARAYNTGVVANERVRFAGLDIPFNQPGKDKLLDYLRRVAPERVAATEVFFQADLDSLGTRRRVAPAQLTANLNKLNELKTNYNELFAFLDLNGASLSAKTSQAEYEQMREYARVLVQCVDSFSQVDIDSSRETRDRYMADNFRRVIDREPPGTRAVIWAHNDHITKDANDWMPQPMGTHLRRFYGSQYYALGFGLNQGTFQAREARPKEAANPMVMTYTLKPAPESSADWVMSQTGVKSFIVDLRSTPKNADVSAWLAAPHLMRSWGSTFDAAFETVSFRPYTLSKQFDGLLFIETTTRARPNPLVKDVAGRTDK